MALRHAVLAALLDGEMSGYQLAKTFDVAVSNYWHALPQQLYGELTKLEREGLITGREVIQQGRPNKRVFTLSEAGRGKLAEFISAGSKPSFIRDDLLVKVRAAEAGPMIDLVEQLEDRAEQARGKIALFEKLLRQLRGDLDEQTYLEQSPRVGPYLTGLRGRAFEEDTLRWCSHAAEVLRARHASEGARPES
ncbi:PadR family transcriptional regulator [Hoyosella subflava]|uniref:PadR-like family transcriptional regulator n=1 Tax=Hoyosella subflava (strain DSM 45089 / JCM 17490 / NBRC 109087 / DQS3-9A1) TaxID=443218 RepID=F6ES01_HOYSD|nr:PadR family transcriptional regulator [Hoyosella subflava]AEF40816.1 PadR-like family transcriptional regulator [Hoyosella subflava DQS3-9A1]